MKDIAKTWKGALLLTVFTHNVCIILCLQTGLYNIIKCESVFCSIFALLRLFADQTGD